MGSDSPAAGTTRETLIPFLAGGTDCETGQVAAPRMIRDGDFVLAFLLEARDSAPANTVFEVDLVATSELPGTVYLATGNAPVGGTCAIVIYGIGPQFYTPFTYRMEVKIAP